MLKEPIAVNEMTPNLFDFIDRSDIPSNRNRLSHAAEQTRRANSVYGTELAIDTAAKIRLYSAPEGNAWRP
jgi:hypothetical protein